MPIYDFVFNFFYRYHKQGKTTQPRINAALAVGITIGSHVFTALSILRYFGIKVLGPPLSDDYFTNRMLMMPFALLATYMITWFYSHKRAMAIVNKWPKDYDVLTLKNVLAVALLMFGPLLIGIQFLNNS